ncbi:ribonuclease J [Candidatus Falkowbacteria bacterium]|nr:ribonuclease J [Candidatus Falkowbacteria bacterium]
MYKKKLESKMAPKKAYKPFRGASSFNQPQGMAQAKSQDLSQSSNQISSKKSLDNDLIIDSIGLNYVTKTVPTNLVRNQQDQSRFNQKGDGSRKINGLSRTKGPKRNGGPRRNDKQGNPFQSKNFGSGSINVDFHKKTNGTEVSASGLIENSLKIYPLGGQEEVGRNCTVFEYDDDIIILDMGLQFSDEDMPGIDYIVPNVSCLRGKEKNIRGVIFSHGHLDHIGGAPILLNQLGNPPIIGRQLTLAMIKHRVEDYRKGTSKNLKTILIKNISDKVTLGKFKISFFQVEHSIIDAVGLIITTPHGTVIHPGDWTFEDGDKPGNTFGYSHLATLPSPKILMLESLGVSYIKERVSVKTSTDNLEKVIGGAKGRVIIGTFASQLERIAHIITYCEKIGKKVALDGYSMKINVSIAQELGYIPPHKNTLISIEKISDYDDDKIVVVCTGAQGESNAVFSRVVNNNHRFVKIRKADTVIFSSSVIPGNERSVQKVKDRVYRLSDNVIHSDIMDIHSGGHANADDIKKVLKQIQPDFFLPVYANHYMLVETKKLAMREGFKEEQIFVLDNGNVINFKKGQKPVVFKEKVNTDYVMVDGLGIGDVSEIVLRDRRMMAGDGMIVVIATIDAKTGSIIGNPDIISRGFVHMKENRDLIEKTRAKVKQIVKDNNPMTPADDDYLKNKIRNEMGQFLFVSTQRRPMVLPVIIKV